MHFGAAVAESSATTLRDSYLQQLRALLESKGGEAGDPALNAAIHSGNAADISITQAATLFARSTPLMDAEQVRYELLD